MLEVKREVGNPEITGGSSCLICLDSEVREINFENEPSSEEETCLKRQLIPIFILRKLLHFPKQECGKLLKKYVLNPDNWCRICNDCAESVEEALDLKRQISDLERKLEAVGTRVRSKLKESLFLEGIPGENDGEREDEAVSVANVIRSYFRVEGVQLTPSRTEEAIGMTYTDSRWNSTVDEEDVYIVPEFDDDLRSPSPIPVEPKYTKYNFRRTRKIGEYGEPEKYINEKQTSSKTAAKKKSFKLLISGNSRSVSKTATAKRKEKFTIKVEDTSPDPDYSGEDNFSDSEAIEVEEPIPETKSKRKRKRTTAKKSKSSPAKRTKVSRSSGKSEKSSVKRGRKVNTNPPEPPFCERCQFLFKHRGSYSRHMQNHKITDQFDDTDTTGKHRVKCKLCGHEDRRVDMYMHVRLHHSDVVGMGTVQCHLCDKQFSCTASLNVHIKARHIEGDDVRSVQTGDGDIETGSTAEGEASKTEPNSGGGGSAANKAVKRAHACLNKKKRKRVGQVKRATSSIPRLLTCDRDDCDFKSIYRGSFQKHKEQHKIKDLFDESDFKATRKIKCKICHEVGFRQQMFMHMRVKHSEVIGVDYVSCHLCDKIFPRKNALTEHIRDIHEKTRRHKCSLCEASFMSRAAFEDHYAKHLSNGQNTIICELCGMSFVSRSKLRRHKRGFHKDNQVWDPSCQESNISCRYCGVRVINNYMLRDHMKITHPEKYKYKCDQCDAMYTERKGLSVHMKGKHSGDVKCQQCGAVLSSVEFLRTHLRSWCKKNPGSSAIEVKHDVEVAVIPESSMVHVPHVVTYVTEHVISEDDVLRQQIAIIQQQGGLNYS